MEQIIIKGYLQEDVDDSSKNNLKVLLKMDYNRKTKFKIKTMFDDDDGWLSFHLINTQKSREMILTLSNPMLYYNHTPM